MKKQKEILLSEFPVSKHSYNWKSYLIRYTIYSSICIWRIRMASKPTLYKVLNQANTAKINKWKILKSLPTTTLVLYKTEVRRTCNYILSNKNLILLVNSKLITTRTYNLLNKVSETILKIKLKIKVSLWLTQIITLIRKILARMKKRRNR